MARLIYEATKHVMWSTPCSCIICLQSLIKATKVDAPSTFNKTKLNLPQFRDGDPDAT